jgi:predicted nucleic acid-binding protein
MSGFLLDTNCIFEVVRPRPELRVTQWLDAADEHVLYLSVLTLGEIRKGLAALPQGRRRVQSGKLARSGTATPFLRKDSDSGRRCRRPLGLAGSRGQAQGESPLDR